MTIIGIDPGGKTGIVAGNWEGKRFVASLTLERKFENVKREFWFYHRLFEQFDPVVVLCETFALRTAVTSEDVTSPIVVRTIIDCVLGDLGYGAGAGGVSPSVAKSTCSDERLRRWGYWIAGSSHIRDAYRQILVDKRR